MYGFELSHQFKVELWQPKGPPSRAPYTTIQTEPQACIETENHASLFFMVNYWLAAYIVGRCPCEITLRIPRNS